MYIDLNTFKQLFFNVLISNLYLFFSLKIYRFGFNVWKFNYRNVKLNIKRLL